MSWADFFTRVQEPAPGRASKVRRLPLALRLPAPPALRRMGSCRVALTVSALTREFPQRIEHNPLDSDRPPIFRGRRHPNPT